MIRAAQPQDAEQITALYNYYIVNTVITFEEERITQAEMARRIESITKTHPWLVYERAGALVAYAYAAPWQPRSAYRLSVETTIYVASDYHGQGVGRELYSALIEQLRNQNFHCALGGIALPNDASIALHEKLGFTKVAELKQVGQKFGKWIDVGYWELIL